MVQVLGRGPAASGLSVASNCTITRQSSHMRSRSIAEESWYIQCLALRLSTILSIDARAERLAATDALEGLLLLDQHGLARLVGEVEARLQAGHALGAGVLAQAALDASVSTKLTCGRSGSSTSAPVGQADTQARQSVHPAVSTTTRPNDAAAGIQPAARIDDERWVCHIGLDAEASRLLNDLYQGAVIDEARRAHLLVPRPRRYARSGARKPGDTNVATTKKKKDGRKLNAGTGHAGRRSAGKSPGH